MRREKKTRIHSIEIFLIVYLASSDLESSSPIISMYQQYRSTNKNNPNNNRGMLDYD